MSRMASTTARARRRPRHLAAAGIAVLILIAVGTIGIVTATSRTSGADGSWQSLPTPPLSPRASSLGYWTGSEVVLIGGTVQDFCPPAADCTASTNATDGAAYDPVAGTWRTIAAAPAPVAGPSNVTIGDRLVVVLDEAWWLYDASDDSWSALPDPPQPAAVPQSALGDLVYAMYPAEGPSSQRPVQVLDLADNTWSSLPDDPLGPMFDGFVTATDDGIVVTGKKLVPQPGSETPAVVIGTVYTGGAWTALPPSEQAGGWFWHYTGTRMVDVGLSDPPLRPAEPFPTGGILEPSSGTWAALPGAEDLLPNHGWDPRAALGSRVVSDGYLYDDVDQSWTPIAPPDDAAVAITTVLTDQGLFVFGGTENDDSTLTNRAAILRL